jgi:formylglycine-generating enzyme required for sulfatase activity
MGEFKYFLSYAREDKDFVLQLAKELRAVDVNLWLDQIDILGGQLWDRAVSGALKACQGMIVILSPESVVSDNVMDEIFYALDEKRLVLPVLLRPCDIPYRLRRVQHIDFTGDYNSGFSQLLKALRIEQSPLPPTIKNSDHPDLYTMVEVPDGEFIYQNDSFKIKKPYMIDVFPVTNIQFRKFIEAGGYMNLEFWSGDGKKWLKELKAASPAYWENKEWNQPEHPVVGVSFYEAEAYSKWSGKRLPTEKEWERAARGTDGRTYPWGNLFDPERCNTAESKIEHTTPVTHYPKGVSLAGCYDMAGNVWEWCQDWHDESKSRKVIRGGSWNFDHNYAVCSERNRTSPKVRNENIGFRCVNALD